ncbi:hypothetical protein [Streptomyces sp. NPDC049744]|uniref:hypothetical protein n=1 Tax=Streptomyces sp. NPDC049744 TaxID=3154359 RepID=UPI0034329C25
MTQLHHQQDTEAVPPASTDETGLEVREGFTKKSEFAPHVTITEETFFGHGWQPLTIAFAQALWFLPSNQSFDVPFLVSWLDRIGWKGANGKPIGENVVRRELKLLREAGYVQSHRLRGEGGKAVGIQYVVSQRRTDQPETGAWIPASKDYRSSDHMPSMATRGQSPHVAIDKKPSSDHMPPLTARGQSPHVADGAKPQVTPHATNELPPPHPPEEVETSSPYPLTDSSPALPSQREEGAEFSPEEIAAAERFLQTLRKPWQAGRATARKCAPLLLREMRELGWPPIGEVDQPVLEQEILKHTEGAKSPAHILPKWIKDLRLYSVVIKHGRPASGPAVGRCARHPNFAEGDCSPCRLEARRRAQPEGAGPAPVNGAELLARLRAGVSDTAS